MTANEHHKNSANEVQLVFPDGKQATFQAGVLVSEIAASIGPGLARAAVGAVVGERVYDLLTPVHEGGALRILTAKDEESVHILRHSAAHVMADAVQRLYPGTKVTIGPSVENGFYYDFDRDTPFTHNDLEKIEAEMQTIINAAYDFKREEVSRQEAFRLFEKMGENYKLELLEAIPEDETVSLYRHGEWFDLCRGPHLSNTQKIKAIKLISVAGAYWRGDERNKMLQRIYGTAFWDKKALKQHLHMLEEAKKRDHRKLGKELDLFSIHDEIGGGLALWHPKGAMIRYMIEEFWRKAHLHNGYDLVTTPHVARDRLWQRSGHLEWYNENMFAGMDVEGQNYLVKPMNCPYHITMFGSKLRSYRDLPMRWAELGTVYRYERSGVLHGLLRVRGFTQDDAHLFMRKDQLKAELDRVLAFNFTMLKAFGFEEFSTYFSTKPEKYVGSPEIWELAETEIEAALKRAGLSYKVDAGGGAFYGPKIDIKLKDSLGREWQCSTIQVDFALPERFELEYVGEDGQRHRPIMIHRALLGSIERFFAVLLEHYAGNFPAWLASEQVRILPVTDAFNAYGKRILETVKKQGTRASLDSRSDKLGAKIRLAETEKVPFMWIIGEKEADNNSVTIRRHGGENLGTQDLDQAVRFVLQEAAMPEFGNFEKGMNDD